MVKLCRNFVESNSDFDDGMFGNWVQILDRDQRQKKIFKDHFDEKVTAVLQKIGEANIISLNTVNYTHLDLASRQLVSDYGVLIIYRG